MLRTRDQQEEWESRNLAPYAMAGGASRGRLHPEPRHDIRTEFQRDRDRIVHSRCFRRLEYKTQVFVNGTADHYRTRLTHTIEVAAVSRTLARALGANEDLAETIALAHDIGHSPFGHMGERALDELMKDEGGFDHNAQSLRWVEILEPRYPGFDGLNLTWEVRAGLCKHLSKVPGARLDDHPIGPFQFLEAQIADVADDMTYYAHDIDDGLDAGLLTPEQLESLEIWRMAGEQAAREYPGLGERHRLGMTVRCLLDLQVRDVLRYSEENLSACRPKSPGEVMNAPSRMVAYTPALWNQLVPLRKFLFEHVYWHPSVHRANEEAVAMMRKLFLYYVGHPGVMGRKAQARLARDGIWRTACDYVSGMTDRYALEEFQKFGLRVD
ncbi:MAG TPA: deoxyguanosinetriphosphate triphosphohydrolase [Kiritimatiellia bacterium]|nr:deoxyguanosinetriphosphate triphosphohydrolase [Kiritimatiellia bacterium]HMO98261.1 deoxyguanosinetriphosphate triphosphohydrolase [Kiritimatiellia bacterium]HMP96258.1 deoxyguanosinetriphosphate triphosphohydrolase [Kiritimatiellia bacterium]